MIKFLMVSAVDNSKPLEENHPALGFGYIASSLRQEFGDRITFKVINRDLACNIKEFQPDIVGITSVSKNYNIAKEYARTARQANIPVVMGGVHISNLPQTLTEDMVVGVAGEGEETTIDLMKLYMAEGEFKISGLYGIGGIIFRDNGELVKTKQRGLVKSLDSIPYPARDLLEIHEQAHMLSSRGCPYHCIFCSTSRYTRNRVRYASPEYVATELELLHSQYKVNHITIYDDLFAMNTKRVIEIYELMKGKKLLGKFDISVNMRANFVTEELVEVLKNMGVKVVALGVETGCQKTLDYLKDGLTVEDNANAVEVLKRHNIIPYCSFIIGSPDEDLSSVNETIKFIKNHKLYRVAIVPLIPFPGTPVWDYALSQGLVSEDMDWSRLDFNIGVDPVLLAKHIGPKEITDIYLYMSKRQRNYLRRLNALLAVKHPYSYIKVFLKIIAGKVRL